MVAGWRVFGLVPDEKADSADNMSQRSIAAGLPAVALQSSAHAAATSDAPRRLTASAMQTASAANDTGGTERIETKRETRVFATTAGSGQVKPFSPSASRTRGIGNRFRAVGTNTMEKLK